MAKPKNQKPPFALRALAAFAVTLAALFVLLLAAMYGLYEAEKKRIAPADELPMARMRWRRCLCCCWRPTPCPGSRCGTMSTTQR